MIQNEKIGNFQDKLRGLNPMARLKVLKTFSTISTKIYNVLCQDCRLKVQRKKDGFIVYCDSCKKKTEPLTKELQEVLGDA